MSSTLRDFLRATLTGGPAVAVTTAPVSTTAAHTGGTVVRRLDGSRMRDRDGLFLQYATAWNFPDYFGWNMDAFDDCMTDLDGQVPPQRTASGAAPTGFLTIIEQAEQLLADAEPLAFAQFAQAQAEYRDAYRVPFAYGADRPLALTFGLVLCTGPKQLPALRRRWQRAGAEPVAVSGEGAATGQEED